MSSVLETLDRQLGQSVAPRAGYCVAFSGGLDSMVLLHALHQLRSRGADFALRAVHIHHGLQPQADEWVAHCETMAVQLDVPFLMVRVTVEVGAGEGLEAAARRARYDAFARELRTDEHLLTAHHAEDQLETYLLRLLRGAGVHGLASIAPRSPFAGGWLQRPLLTVARSALEDYARAHGLIWIEDPSNTDTRIDRNYLRHVVVPALRKKWPGVASTVGRAARLSAEATDLIDGLASDDCDRVIKNHLIEIPLLRELPPARQRNVLRHVLRQQGRHPPSEVQLIGGLDQLLSAGADRQPVLHWSGGQIRRYRQRLYILDDDPTRIGADVAGEYSWDGQAPLVLGPMRGRIQLTTAVSGGFSFDPSNGPLQIRFRHGGERLQEADHLHHIQLKKLFQSRGIVPWMRPHIPLLVQAGTLLAVGDFWVRASASSGEARQHRVIWDQHPVFQ